MSLLYDSRYVLEKIQDTGWTLCWNRWNQSHSWTRDSNNRWTLFPFKVDRIKRDYMNEKWFKYTHTCTNWLQWHKLQRWIQKFPDWGNSEIHDYQQTRVKLPSSTQLRLTWHPESLDILVLPSTVASFYHNCSIDGGTSPEYFGCTLALQSVNTGFAP
jgi:hypothetical protein